MKRIFTLATTVFTLAPVSLADEKLVNGDFEQAGAPGTMYCGPGWLSDGGFSVVWAGGWWQGSGPFNKSKAIGVASRNLIDQGKAEQTIEVSPGLYKAVITGHAWIYDSYCGDGCTSYIDCQLRIDGNLVRARRFGPEAQKKWFTIRYEWTGRINDHLSLALIGRADGRGPGEAWGVVVTDCWSVDLTANPPAEPNLLTNGSFEQAGPVGGNDPGPGWTGPGKLKVLTYGATDHKANLFGPYDGEKAMGLLAHSEDLGGMIEQTASVPPGDYMLTLTGHIFMWDTFGGDALNTQCDVWFNVDGRPVRYKRVYCTSPLGPNESWGNLKWTWSGHVQKNGGVALNAQARGRGPETSWGLCAVDGWTLDAKPIKSLPTEGNLLINGDFEQARAFDSKDAGSGWTTNPKKNMRVLSEFDIHKNCGEGHPARVHPDYSARSGRKSMGVIAHGQDDSGTLEQAVTLEAGEYDIELTGYMWLYNTYGGDQDNAYTEVFLKVDGKQVKYKRTYAGEEEFPDCWWCRLHWVWSGRVDKEVRLLIDAQARGRGPENSWAICGLDDWCLRAKKMTQRATPIVEDDGDYTTDPTQLHARWRFPDAGDDSPTYQYAIGTSKGGTDLLDWTDVGPMTEITRAGLSLKPGVTYYIGVKATTGDGHWTPPGSSDGIRLR
jgi:hypothetical protein